MRERTSGDKQAMKKLLDKTREKIPLLLNLKGMRWILDRISASMEVWDQLMQMGVVLHVDYLKLFLGCLRHQPFEARGRRNTGKRQCLPLRDVCPCQRSASKRLLFVSTRKKRIDKNWHSRNIHDIPRRKPSMCHQESTFFQWHLDEKMDPQSNLDSHNLCSRQIRNQEFGSLTKIWRVSPACAAWKCLREWQGLKKTPGRWQETTKAHAGRFHLCKNVT